MSSTTGVQNLLVNVFRPVYTYDATTTLFTPKLELSNIDNYSGNTISVFTAAVGDSRSNVYVGSNAGNPYTTTKACSNVTALGFSAAAGISNVSNSVFLGYNAAAGATLASNNVSVGDNTTGNGTFNVRIGSASVGTGDNNTVVGAVTSTATYSNCVLLGPAITATANNEFRVGSNYLYGNLSNKWLGVGRTAPIDSNSRFDVSGNVYVSGQIGVNMVPVRTLDVNGDFRASDANGTLDFSNGVTYSSNGFASIRGTTTVSGGVTNIGVLKKGVVLISAVDSANSSKHAARYVLAETNSSTSELGSNVSGGSASITFSTSNIQISDAANGTYDWSITYFPL